MIGCNDSSVEVHEISKNVAKSLCLELIEKLPEYFGLVSANRKYIHGVEKNKNFAVKINDSDVGLISINFPYPHNINIYWLGVFPQYHFKGLGSRLVEKIFQYAAEKNINTISVETLAPNYADKNYIKTYNFYVSKGFQPLFNLTPKGYKWEMVYMVKILK